jgi:hypothetical protein
MDKEKNRCKAITGIGRRCLNGARQRGFCLIHSKLHPTKKTNDLDEIPEGKRGTIRERLKKFEKAKKEMEGRIQMMKKAQMPFAILCVLIVIVGIVGGIGLFITHIQMNGYCRECGYHKSTDYNNHNDSLIKIECDKVHYIYREIIETTQTDKWGNLYLNWTAQLNCKEWN